MLKFSTTKVNGDLVNVLLQPTNYGDLLAQDLETLKAIDLEELKANALIDFGATETDVMDALHGDGSVRGRKGLITSLLQSIEGKNTDHHPNPNLVKHPSIQSATVDTTTNFVYVSGLVVSETMAIEGAVKTPKKEVKSGLVVQLKSWIEYTYKLKACKYRTYKLDPSTLIETV